MSRVELPLTFLLCLTVAVSSLIGCGSGKPVDGGQAEEKEKKSDAEKNAGNPLTIAKTGPYPKAVADELEFEFEAMVVGGKGEHTFKIRNDGEAPLKIKKGGSTCKCTLGKFENEEIPPGETAEIEVSWKMPHPTDNFKHGVRIWTNDPENQSIRLNVAGAVQELLVLDPPSSWVAEKVNNTEPTVLSGRLYSPFLEEFEILELSSKVPEHISTEFKPLSAEELDDLDAMSGYSVTVTIKPSIPIGRFIEQIKCKTTARHPLGTERTDLFDPAEESKGDDSQESEKKTDEERGKKKSEESKGDESGVPQGDEPVEFSFFVEGSRSGPIQFLPMPGVTWYAQTLGIMMNEFKAEKGNKAKINMFVDGEMEVAGIETDPEFLKLHVERDEAFKAEGKQRFILTFEVPPGSPATVRSYGNTGKVTLKTTHPDAKEIRFKIGFTSMR